MAPPGGAVKQFILRWVIPHWRAVTLAVFGAGAVAIAMWLIVLTGRVNKQEATRVATIEASYDACIRSIPVLTRFNLALEGAEKVAGVLLQNLVETHRLTNYGSPLYFQQLENIDRLRMAIVETAGVDLPVPKRSECVERRDRALAN